MEALLLTAGLQRGTRKFIFPYVFSSVGRRIEYALDSESTVRRGRNRADSRAPRADGIKECSKCQPVEGKMDRTQRGGVQRGHVQGWWQTRKQGQGERIPIPSRETKTRFQEIWKAFRHKKRAVHKEEPER